MAPTLLGTQSFIDQPSPKDACHIKLESWLLIIRKFIKTGCSVVKENAQRMPMEDNQL
jgi:hypothetical protein